MSVVDDVKNGGIVGHFESGCTSPTEDDVQCARNNKREPDDAANGGGRMAIVDKRRYRSDLERKHGRMKTNLTGRCKSWIFTKAKLPITYPITVP